DGVARGTATATAGSYSITTSTALTPGPHLVTATATDAAGNVSAASAPLSVTVDTVKPTVTVNQAAGQADPTNAAPVHFTAAFSEAVYGFTASDVTLAGTATGRSVLSVTDSGDQMTYDVAVTATGGGTITASVAAGLVQDAAGNLNAASTSTDNSVTYDTTAPTAASVTTPANGSFLQTATVPASFSGGVADNTNGVGLNANSATFTLRRGSDGFYWTGSAWQAAAFSLAATNSATTGSTAATWTSSATLPSWGLQ